MSPSTRIRFLAAGLAPLAGCNGAGGTGDENGRPPPAIGTQIDRMGRPGLNSLLTDPFDSLQNMTPDQAKDAYNLASHPKTWDATVHENIKASVAFCDG